MYLHLRTGPNPQRGLDPIPNSVPRTETLSSLLSARDRTLNPNLPGTGPVSPLSGKRQQRQGRRLNPVSRSSQSSVPYQSVCRSGNPDICQIAVVSLALSLSPSLSLSVRLSDSQSVRVPTHPYCYTLIAYPSHYFCFRDACQKYGGDCR